MKIEWKWPEDAKRNVVAPEGETVEVRCGAPFRLDVVDPAAEKTLCAVRDATDLPGGGWSAAFSAPRYEGDGTRCRPLAMRMTAYPGGAAERTESLLEIPPPPEKARARLELDGDEIRRDPCRRAVLSNGAGAASQIRAAWGRIASQYDSLLAANPDPSRPTDRVNTLARMRCWARWAGYSQEFDARSAASFAADPSGESARWDFSFRFCEGATASFSITVSQIPGVNAIDVRFARAADTGETQNAADEVAVVIRPDVEWRSFHDTTKAYAGAEQLFPRAVTPGKTGFRFAPFGGVLAMEISNDGKFSNEPEWLYGVAHPEEAERGQEPSGDLFSPGWFSATLKPGEAFTVSASAAFDGDDTAPRPAAHRRAAAPSFKSETPIPQAMRKALDLFIAKRDGLKTVIAGYPWFLDWGRDTFIFMRGMIAAGRIDDSLDILKAFAAFEEKGTLPNIIYGGKAGNRDTTDAQLWFIRCVKEIEEAGADAKSLRPVCESIADNYIAGTPNGIKTDPESGLVWSPSHFTWMDTNYPACTPREGYPVEIQALWISALEYLGRGKLAAKAKRSILELFPREGGGFCDCIAAPPGTPAREATKDESLRPNQLLLATLGVLDDPSIPVSCAPLAVPGSIRSLAPSSPYYRGAYTGDEDTSRKPAYHNGTAWGWMFPSYPEALVETGAASRRAALSILASAVENLNGGGTVGHLSEISDGDSPHAQKGCTAQAWSESELLRVWLKLAEKGV